MTRLHDGPPRVLTLGGAVAALVLLLALPLVIPPESHASPGSLGGKVVVRNVTADLGTVFTPGIPLGLASNTSTTYLGGIGIYHASSGFSLPVLAALTIAGGIPTISNMTSQVSGIFPQGGVYALGWNGTSWLVGGQGLPDPNNIGRLASIRAGIVTDLDALVQPYFGGGGIWSIGWNGSDWLIGGNSSSGVSLLSWDGRSVTDLSPLLHDHSVNGWIQLLAWNGREWLVGGSGILELLRGTTAIDLLPQTPFVGNGAYSAGWNGTSWLVGGGGGARLEEITGTSVTPGPSLPSRFDQVVLMVTPTTLGWLFAGKGTAATGGSAPELALWPTGGGPVADLSTKLPSAFAGGEIQGGAATPDLGAGVLLLVGEGRYDPVTGLGFGAAAELAEF